MDTRYLFKRYNTWWVKLAVPRTLREQLGYDLRESLKNRLVKNLLNEKSFYNTGKFKYEKPNTSVSGSKNTPGIKETESTLKKSKK